MNHQLCIHLRENRLIESIRRFASLHLHLSRSDVMAKRQAGDPAWEGMVPPQAVQLIKTHALFGSSGAGLNKDSAAQDSL
jgi:hypothetical protein